MKLKRIVTHLPLTTLWKNDQDIEVTQKEYLDKEAIRELLKQGLVEFVVADCGSELQWIPADKCFEFWKTEVQDHVDDDLESIYLENFPGEYAYVASKWTGISKHPIILLEQMH